MNKKDKLRRLIELLKTIPLEKYDASSRGFDKDYETLCQIAKGESLDVQTEFVYCGVTVSRDIKTDVIGWCAVFFPEDWKSKAFPSKEEKEADPYWHVRDEVPYFSEYFGVDLKKSYDAIYRSFLDEPPDPITLPETIRRLESCLVDP